MSSEIIPAIEIPADLVRVDDSIVQDVLKSGDFLPYITVTNSGAELVKEDKVSQGKIAVIVDKNPIDLGKECVVVVIAERAKAMVFGDQVLNYFDPHSDEFKSVMLKSKTPNSGNMAGLEFLVWIPSQGEKGLFAGLFCGTPTFKREAPNVRNFLGGRAMTMKVNHIKTGKYSWFGFLAVPHTAPVGNRPDPEELAEQLQKFRNPVSSMVQQAPESSGASRAR